MFLSVFPPPRLISHLQQCLTEVMKIPEFEQRTLNKCIHFHFSFPSFPASIMRHITYIPLAPASSSSSSLHVDPSTYPTTTQLPLILLLQVLLRCRKNGASLAVLVFLSPRTPTPPSAFAAAFHHSIFCCCRQLSFSWRTKTPAPRLCLDLYHNIPL